ncbi:MAG: RNA polymerase subunit sigma-70 [Treponema sp.]|nr:MAG: RNA polymerase subunit sigma-70 [Treponema sp.]
MSDKIFKQYITEVTKYNILSAEEEAELAKRTITGDEEAINKLVKHNLRLVVKVVLQSSAKNSQNIMDIIQEGNLGLIKAAEKFHPKFKTRFCTYATFWIRQAITRYLGTCVRKIRLPIRKEELMIRINKASLQFQANHGYKPSYSQLSKLVNVSVETIKEMFDCTTEIYSLDAPIANDSKYSNYEVIKNMDYMPEDVLEEKEIAIMVDKILNLLPELERDILIRRRCLKGYPRKESLYHIAEVMGISAEGVRQIELRALKKLKYHRNEIKSIATV